MNKGKIHTAVAGNFCHDIGKDWVAWAEF